MMQNIKNDKTLVIDSYFQPVMIITWKKAFCLLFTGKATVVKESNIKYINSTSKSFKFPTVIQIYAKINYNFKINLNRWSIFARDNFSCAYCGNSFQKKDLSLDHIHPVSKGGKSSWENLITACYSCNQKKSNKSLEEIGFKMKFKPYKPIWSSDFMLKLYQINKPLEDWKDFF